MSTKTLTCLACGSDFTVDSGQDESRCLHCGTKYAAPWDDPEVVRSPISKDEWALPAEASESVPVREGVAGDTEAGAAEADDETAINVNAEGGATVTITITVEVSPEGG